MTTTPTFDERCQAIINKLDAVRGKSAELKAELEADAANLAAVKARLIADDLHRLNTPFKQGRTEAEIQSDLALLRRMHGVLFPVVKPRGIAAAAIAIGTGAIALVFIGLMLLAHLLGG